MCVFIYVSNKHEAEKHIVFATPVMQSQYNMAVAIVPLPPTENRLLGFWADKQGNGV